MGSSLARRSRQPGDEHEAKRRSRGQGRVGNGGGPLRPPGEPADASRARQLRWFSRARAGPAAETRGGPCAWWFRVCGVLPAVRREPPASLRPRCRAVPTRWALARCFLPPQPAEHLHWAAHRAHARRCHLPCPRPRPHSHSHPHLRLRLRHSHPHLRHSHPRPSARRRSVPRPSALASTWLLAPEPSPPFRIRFPVSVHIVARPPRAREELCPTPVQ